MASARSDAGDGSAAAPFDIPTYDLDDYPSDDFYGDDDPYDEGESLRAWRAQLTGNWAAYDLSDDEEPDDRNCFPRDIAEDNADHSKDVHVDDYARITMSAAASKTTGSSCSTWSAAEFNTALMANVRAQFTALRPLQEYVIPAVMAGRDVKCEAPSGSGKTAAFLLPIIDWISKKKSSLVLVRHTRQPFALILEPTRELCKQVYDEAQTFAKLTDVQVAKAYGGYYFPDNVKELTSGCDILVATAGRLRALISANVINFVNLRFLVLDEADSLLDDGFMVDIRELLASDGFPNRDNRQTLLFSSAFPDYVQLMANEVLHSRYTSILHTSDIVTESSQRIDEHFLEVRKGHKFSQLRKLFEDDLRAAQAMNPDVGGPQVRRTLVFVRTKRATVMAAVILSSLGFIVPAMHSDLLQVSRERTLREFNLGHMRFVVTTDVMARGLKIRHLDQVINLDLPLDFTVYKHRVGRLCTTYGKRTVKSFFDPSDGSDRKFIRNLAEDLQRDNKEVPEVLAAVLRVAAPDYTTHTASASSGSPAGAYAHPPPE